MNGWMMWTSFAVILVILELFTGTFYLLMVAIGLLAGAISAYFQLSGVVQAIVASAVGSVAALALRNSKYGGLERSDASRDPNVNMDIGQSLQVNEWKDLGNGKFVARTMYRGAMWDVELQHSAGYPGAYTIEEIQGSRLIVKPS